MTEAEKLLCIINEISANKRIGIFEAVILYAEENISVDRVGRA